MQPLEVSREQCRRPSCPVQANTDPLTRLSDRVLVISNRYDIFETTMDPELRALMTHPKTQTQGIGGALLLLCLVFAEDTSLSHRFLNCAVLQYLGKVHFSLYLVHDPIQSIIEFWFPHLWWMMLGQGLLSNFQEMGVLVFVAGLMEDTYPM